MAIFESRARVTFPVAYRGMDFCLQKDTPPLAAGSFT